MTVRLISADGLWGGAEYAYASVSPAGSLVFTAGACPLTSEGVIACPGDVAGQARQAAANLAEALHAAGAGLDSVLKTTIYVASASRADLVTAWDVIRSAFGDHDAPSTLLGVTVLGYPDQRVEIEAVAVGPVPA